MFRKQTVKLNLDLPDDFVSINDLEESLSPRKLGQIRQFFILIGLDGRPAIERETLDELLGGGFDNGNL